MKKRFSKCLVFLCVTALLITVFSAVAAAKNPSIVQICDQGGLNLMIASDGYMYRSYGANTPEKVSGTKDIKAAAVIQYYQIVLILKKDGTVWSFKFEQADNSISSLKQIKELTSVSAVTAGTELGYALKKDGTVYKISSSKVQRLAGVKNITAISARNWSVVALAKDGTVMQWYIKSDFFDWQKSKSPAAVKGLKSVAAVAQGSDFRLALKKDGTVWAWGSNIYGQLGTGKKSDDPIETPVQVKGLKKIKMISAGRIDALALDSSGNVWKWGRDDLSDFEKSKTYTLPVKLKLSGIKLIASGGYDVIEPGGGGFSPSQHLAVDKNSNVYIWSSSVGNTPVKIKFE